MCPVDEVLQLGEMRRGRRLTRNGVPTFSTKGGTLSDESDSNFYHGGDNIPETWRSKPASASKSQKRRSAVTDSVWTGGIDNLEKRQMEDVDGEGRKGASDEELVELSDQTTEDTASDEGGLKVPPAPKLNPIKGPVRRISFFELPPAVLTGAPWPDSSPFMSPDGTTPDILDPGAPPPCRGDCCTTSSCWDRYHF